MRFISTRTHGMIDYAVGLLLIAAPFLLGFADGGPAMWVPIILGLGTIAYSLMTDYEMGVASVLSMPAHLVWPHLIVGILEIGASLTTRTVRGDALGTVGASGAARY